MEQIIRPEIIEFLLKQLPWWLIGFWTIYAILSVFIKPIRHYISNFYIIESIPNVFVTLGLFGTFTGIAYGLLNFDTTPDHIKDSIKLLLDGLKSAMFTSIVGILLSLIFSKIIKIFIDTTYIEVPESPELEELRNLNRNFEEFKNAISTTHYNAIVDAFREVITNFNEVFQEFIKELVQSNFNELTRTINELSTWQREHKEDVEALKTAYKNLVTQHQNFAHTTMVWVSKLDEISGQSSKLQKVIDEFNSAFNEDGNLSRILNDVQGATSELMKVTENFNKLTTKMNETTDSIKVTSDKITEWNNSVAQLKDSVKFIVQKVEAFQGLELNKVNKVLSSIDALFLKYIEDLEDRMNKR
jgi:methyl-accepting chemotaxis protein